MGKHKLQKHHLYLGIGGMLAVTALVVALTFGLSKAQDMGGTYTPPPGGTGTYTPPPGGTGTYTPPPGGTGTYTPPPGGTGTYTPPPGGTYTPPPTGGALCPSGSQYPNVAPPPDKDCYGNPVGGYMPPAGGTYPTDSPSCTAQGKVWCSGTNGATGWCKSDPGPCPTTTMPPAGTNMPVCAAGQQPSQTNPCYMSGYQTPPSGTQYPTTGGMMTPTSCSAQGGTWRLDPMGTNGSGGCNFPITTGGAAGGADPLCWDSTNTAKFASPECTAARARVNDSTGQYPTGGTTGGMVNCPALNNRQVSPQECGNATPVCGSGQTPEKNFCKPQSGTQYNQQPAPSCPQGEHWAFDMNKCARNLMPGETSQGQNQPYMQNQQNQPQYPNNNQFPQTGPYPQMPNNQRPAAGDQPYNYGQTQCVPGNHPTPDGRCEPDRGFRPVDNWGSEDKEGYNQAQQEQWAKMDEQNKQRQLKDMKMGVKGFKTGIKQFQKMVDKATKKNIAIPETVTQALEKANSIITTVTNAATLEAVLDAPMDEMPDIMEVLMDGEQTLRVLQELPKIQRQFTKQLAAVNKRIDKAERAAKRAKIVVTNTVAEVRSIVEEVQAAFDAFVTSAQEGGDMGDLFSAMQDVTEPYDTVNEKLYVIEAAAKSKNIVRDTKNKVSGYKREAKKAAPRDATVSSAITSLQSSADELQTLLKEEFNEEDFFDALETVYDAESAVIDALSEATGKEYPMPFPPQPQMQLFGTGGPGLFQGVPQGFESMNTQGPPPGMGGPQYGSPMGGQTEAPGGYYNQGSIGGGNVGESNPSPAP